MTAPRWFHRVGAPVSVEERALIDVAMHCASGASLPRILGRGQACSDPMPGSDDNRSGSPIEVVTGTALAQVLLLESHDNQWWDAEEGERERLWDMAAERLSESDLVLQLESAASIHHDAVASAAAGQITPIAIDRATAHLAADSARLALHQRALAELAAVSSDHWFRIKFALFESGRWPLGSRGGRFYLV